MFGQMAKAMAAMVVGLIVIASIFFNRDWSMASAAPSPDSLTRKDVFGSARLSAAERADGLETCNRRISEFSFATVRIKKRMANGEREKALQFCDCFVNQVEDRSSRMQYAMAMTVLSKGYAIRDARSFPAFSDYKAAARTHGMSGDEFDTIRRELGRSMVQSAEQCVMNLIR